MDGHAMKVAARGAFAAAVLCAASARAGGAGVAVTLPAAPTAVERFAAKELADALEKCLGARPAIAAEGETRGPALFVGATKASAAARGARGWQADGIFLKSVPGGVVLDGDPARGPAYAAHTYLEKFCGVRWWTSDASRHPRLAAAPLDGIDLEYAPKIKYRETYYLDGFDPLFKVRSKGNFTSLTRYLLSDVRFVPPEMGGDHRLYFFKGRRSAYHSFFEILPPDVWFAKRPEWYSLAGGKRVAKQLCLSNAEMKKEFAKQTLARLREDPSVDFIQVSQNDWNGRCECAGCRAMEEYDGSPSGPYLRFANEIAEAVEKEFPDVKIDMFAYLFTRKAPLHTRPRRNVTVRLCDIECDFSRPLSDRGSESNSAFAKDLAEWSKAAGGNLYVWDYLANFSSYMMPHPNIASIAPNIRLFAAHGAVGVFEQGDALCSAGSFAALRHYLASHLLWDPGDDEHRLVSEFLEGYYGKSAAPLLARLIALTDGAPRRHGFPVGCYHNGAPFLEAAEKLEAARLADAAEAAAAADGPEYAARVARERLSFDHMLLLNYDVLRGLAAANKIPWTRPADRAAAVEKWIGETKRLGVRAWRETTDAADIERYFKALRRKGAGKSR